MGNKRFLKVFTILLISTAFIFSFSHFGALAIANGFGHKEKYAQGTAAGGIQLSGLTEEQAQQKLSSAVQKWKASNPVEIVYLAKTVKLPAEQLHFSVTESMLRVKNGQASPLVVTLDHNGLRDLVSKSFPDVSPDDVDIARLDMAICHAAARLETANLSFDLSGYALDGNERERKRNDSIKRFSSKCFDCRSNRTRKLGKAVSASQHSCTRDVFLIQNSGKNRRFVFK
ncbi:hypothetical protein [Heyndrickxia coagulans]|uniref:hypothetical protein n=1 Tax=Heyndrickxia coagulans TaxID=1398 RepID=UPI001F1CF312|nr:hypothetical protein [Heyndrickxia coagulans]